MKKIALLLALMLTALTYCYSQSPDSIASGNRLIPSWAETNLIRIDNAAHKFKDLAEVCQQENDSLRSVNKDKTAALSECDEGENNLKKQNAIKDSEISGLKSENHSLHGRVYLLSAGVILEGIALYVMIFKR